MISKLENRSRFSSTIVQPLVDVGGDEGGRARGWSDVYLLGLPNEGIYCVQLPAVVHDFPLIGTLVLLRIYLSDILFLFLLLVVAIGNGRLLHGNPLARGRHGEGGDGIWNLHGCRPVLLTAGARLVVMLWSRENTRINCVCCDTLKWSRTSPGKPSLC